MHQALAYFRFLWKSQNQHGLHSPFVYQLVTCCFYDRKKYPAYKKLKSYRSKLLANKNTIEVTDFGAGSRIFKSNTRKISEISKIAGITRKKARFLFRLTNYLEINNSLELGTSVGIATVAMALANPKKIVTIEGCPETAGVARQYFKEFDLKNIDSRIGNFKNCLPNLAKTESFDLIYFDGNHQKEATLQYFNQLKKTAHNDSIFVFDDIHLSPEMEETWESIKQDLDVQVTIDTFYVGLVFFRKQQAKQHFTIRL
ncbi:O-methyltransferase [Zunongwangia sp.]|uniref:O-methyltransferase n=1 Tax=Zunongwangia sp. TaxID=1965325 RepID=UPI003AA92182